MRWSGLIGVDGETTASSQRWWGWEKNMKVKKHGSDIYLLKYIVCGRFCWLDSCVGIYVFLVSRAGFYFLFFTSLVFFFPGFMKKKKERYTWEAERRRERDTRKRCLLIHSFGEKVCYLINLGTRSLDRKFWWLDL